MTHPTIKELHVRQARIRLDRKTLERIVLEYAMQQVGFYEDATKAEIRFSDATEGSPAYRVGTECVVVLREDQMLMPKDGGAK